MKPILLDIPESFDTERLTIRAPRVGDGTPMNEAILESLEHLRPWMPWAHTVPTVEDSEENVRQAHIKFLQREDFRLHLWLKNTETFVGGSGLHRFDWAVPRFELGYWVHKKFEGQGYVTEAVNGITQFAFEVFKAERLEIRCDARNVRSAAVARRCGYTLEGIMRRDSRAPDTGELRDTLVFALVRSEWLAKRV
jgi:RimJ/RimL family protein N-acetyltransferase